MSEASKQSVARTAWLQSVVSHRIVTVSFAKHLYRRCCSIVHTPYDEECYRKMLECASEQLSTLDLDLRTSRDQHTSEAVLAVVNTKADSLIQGATRYSSSEIVVIKKIVEEICKAKKEAYAIAAIEAITLGARSKSNLTRDAVQELLNNLVDHTWLHCSADGIYTLSTRSLLELRSYLQNEIGDEHFHTCTHCKDIVTIGLACSHSPRSCDVRYHLHCARTAIASKATDDDALLLLQGFACVGCRRPWKSRPIGPKALNLAADNGSQQYRPRRRRRDADDDSDDDDDDDDDGDDGEEGEQDASARADRRQTDGDDEGEEDEDAHSPTRQRPIKPEHDSPSSSDQLDAGTESSSRNRPLKRAR